MKWLEVRNAAGETGPAEMLIYDQIGKDWFDGSGIEAKAFADELARIPSTQDIVVGINSPGGNVWDGLAIYHQLQARKERVTCRVDGIAASIASIIAMAGRETRIPSNALFMIHNPFGMAVGDAATMRKTADELDKHKSVLVGIYAAKTGKSEEELSEMMDRETWLTGAEACAAGFADKCEEEKRMVACNFDLSRYRNRPAGVTGGVLPPPTGTNNKGKQTMSEPTKPAPAVEATPAPVATVDAAEFAAVKAQLERERKLRITDRLNSVAAGRNIDVAEWLPRALADESVIDSLSKLPDAGVAPVRPIVEASATEPSEPKNHIEAGKQFVALTDATSRARFYKAHKDKVLASVFHAPRNANSFVTLTHTVLAQRAMEAFTYALTPLRAFSTDFSAEAAQKGDKVKVLFTSAADAALDWAGSYTIQDADAEGKEISIDERKYVSWGLTTEEIVTQPQLRLDTFAVQKGNALAKAMLQDIWSVLTEANYGNSAITTTASGGDQLTVTAANFDLDEVSWLYAACSLDNWPSVPRSLVLSIPYYASLFRESEVVGTDGAKDAMLQQAVIRQLMGFDIYETNAISATATDNVTGFAAHPDGVLVAGRVLLPEAGIANRPTVQVMTEPETGVSIVMREWFEPSNDQSNRVLEVAYGYLKGNANAIKLISSS